MNVKQLTTLGERLEFALDMRDVNKTTLAKAIDKHPSTITGYVTNARKPDPDTLAKICNYLNVNPGFLLLTSDKFNIVEKVYGEDSIQIHFDEKEISLTKNEIEDILLKLKNYGWDVKKILEKK